MDDTKPEQPMVPLDFVYCGRRIMSNGKLAVAIAPIQDGEIQKTRLFLFDRKAHRTIGSVYSGATFSDNHMRGLIADLKFERIWHKQEDRIEWRARDEEVETHLRTKKLEADAKKVNEIETIMLPLRIMMQNFRHKRDYGGMEALEAAVVRALKSKPREGEV
jgi:hypothetical protein